MQSTVNMTNDQRWYAGSLTPDGLARYLLTVFNSGRLGAQQLGQGDHLLVQIGRQRRGSLRRPIGVRIDRADDGISVTIGNGSRNDAATSIVQTLAGFLLSPHLSLWTLFAGVGAQQLRSSIWGAVETYSRQGSDLSLPPPAGGWPELGSGQRLMGRRRHRR